MKSIFICIILLFLSGISYSQLSGDIVKDQRKLISDTPFTMTGIKDGIFVFQISVNAEGKVTSAKVISGESTITSTPARLEATNYVRTFQFEPGTWFPKYHQGKVKIRMQKED